MRRTLLLLALLAPLTAMAQQNAPASPPNPPAPEPWSLERLMQQRAQVERERVAFAETRKIPAADTVIKSKGALLYQAPDRLERETWLPSKERTVIEGERVTLETEVSDNQTSQHQFTLSDLPGLRPFFVALRAMLGGKLEILQRDFSVTLEGKETAWRVRLVPRDRNDQYLRDIVLRGRGRDILAIDMRQKNGDSAHTALTPQTVELKTPPPAAASGS